MHNIGIGNNSSPQAPWIVGNSPIPYFSLCLRQIIVNCWMCILQRECLMENVYWVLTKDIKVKTLTLSLTKTLFNFFLILYYSYCIICHARIGSQLPCRESNCCLWIPEIPLSKIPWGEEICQHKVSIKPIPAIAGIFRDTGIPRGKKTLRSQKTKWQISVHSNGLGPVTPTRAAGLAGGVGEGVWGPWLTGLIRIDYRYLLSRYLLSRYLQVILGYKLVATLDIATLTFLFSIHL